VSERPDILVLGGGGRQGEAWMCGLLAGLEDANGLDFRGCDYFIGTSGGAVLATRLVTGQVLRRPAHAVEPVAHGAPPIPGWAADSAIALAAPLARVGLRLGRSPGELLRAAALRVLPMSKNDSLDFSGAFPPSSTRFDGRLRIPAVDRAAGRRVVFGAPGAPQVSVAEALAASCALPLIFPPAVIDGREYVDGAIWSPTNADVAPAHRDTKVLILAPMASLHGPFNAPVRAASRAAMLLEASALKARGARLRIITPDRNAAASLGNDVMSGEHLRETHAAGYGQGSSLSGSVGQ
jgi:NTE family protein